MEEGSLNRDAEGFASFMSISRGKAAGMGVGHWQGEGEERRHLLILSVVQQVRENSPSKKRQMSPNGTVLSHKVF